MILVASTSSHVASLALFSGGKEVFFDSREAPRAASQAILEMMESSGRSLEEIEVFAADGGPGSFTGVKVAVTLAKTWGWALGKPCAILSAFDLASPSTEVLPARRGHVYRRGGDGVVAVEPGEAPEGVLVSARNAISLLSHLSLIRPEEALPLYGGSPNVSKAKNPVIMGGS